MRPLVLFVAALAAGCSSVVPMSPSLLTRPADAGAGRVVRVRNAVEVKLPTGYHRTIEAGTLWEYHGRIAQGDVWKRRGGVFSVEGKHISEAYLVLEGTRLVGFWLPYEKAFSPLDEKHDLSVENVEEARS